MSRKSRNPERRWKVRFNIFKSLKEETVQGILAIVFFVCAIFFMLAAIGLAGFAGDNVFRGLVFLVGFGYFLIPLLLIILSISFLQSLKKSIAFAQIIGAIVFLLAGLGIIDLLSRTNGGIIGGYVSSPLFKLFAFPSTMIFLGALLVISMLVIFDVALHIDLKSIFLSLIHRKNNKKAADVNVEKLITATTKDSANESKEKADATKEKNLVVKNHSENDAVELPKTASSRSRGISSKPYLPPPLSLLERDSGKPGVGDIKANANIIKRTLQNFGITVEMDEISIGPSVTRYALKPAEGIKLSRIVALQNDLSLALAAHPIRIEAPIPGKSLVGIEIPNSTKTTVGLGTLLSSEEFQKSNKPLLISLGKGISGISHFGNLGKMPHLLIAGATGSGKSVAIHAIITSLLYRNSPESLKFIMIDPKRVELTMYNRIPHLLTPVITDAKKSILSLRWAAKEMERRYNILEENSVRDVESYHKNILAPELKNLEEKLAQTKDKTKESVQENGGDIEMMPYIAIVIDELADIMQTYPRELESAIVRLAQMSRAVGIHLILSTQRPSVNVITGLIKANIPARIALQVASQIDSRTILDMSGAEKLLGAGDMLYLSGEMSQPQRIQSSYISENEVKKVVKFLAENNEAGLVSDLSLSGDTDKNALFESDFGDSGASGDDDDLYEEAREIVVSAGKASTSYLQRKLRIGYARAARLMDILEERGVISAGQGAKPREVIGYGGSQTGEEEIS